MQKMGDFSKYNDYELLYLVRENIDEAREILLWKYSFLIKSRIYKYNVPSNYWDDFYQEGLIMLYKAIRIFDDNSKMSFTNFFELLLKRRILTLLRKIKNDLLCEKTDNFDDIMYIQEEKELGYYVDEGVEELSEFEKHVFNKIILSGYKIEQLSKELGVSSKSISNAKQRVLKKIKNKYYRYEKNNNMYN